MKACDSCIISQVYDSFYTERRWYGQDTSRKDKAYLVISYRKQINGENIISRGKLRQRWYDIVEKDLEN